jgi:flagellar motor switch/type III secretory pathway protein FliN
MVNNAFNEKRKFNAEFLKQLADKYAGASPKLPQKIAVELKKYAALDNAVADVDEFWNNAVAGYQKEQAGNLNQMQKKMYTQYNTTVELGRTEISGNEIAVEFGKADLNVDSLGSRKVGTGFRLDVEISPEAKPIVSILVNGKLAAKGRPKLIYDNKKIVAIGNIGVVVTEVYDEADSILSPLKGSVTQLDNRTFYHPEERGSVPTHILSRLYTMLLCNVFFKGRLIAKGRISNPQSIFNMDNDYPVEQRYSIMLDEIISENMQS